MCGIAGIFTFETEKSADWLKQRITSIVTEQRHRGPDASGIWIAPDGHAALGHRRLSIIDLDPAANQPFRDKTGQFQIVFNGEIYNYRELRSELKTFGRSFTTQSDTEVLLEAYLQWGENCLSRLDGMYSFAVYNTIEKSFFLARDPFGEKPLYYSHSNGVFAFASELKALATLPELDRTIEERTVAAYLAFQYIPGDGSLYRGAKKLKPGHFLRINSKGCIQTSKHFEFSPSVIKSSLPLDELADELEELLISSLSRRMRADVPVGVFLSGGIDSSVVASLTSLKLGLALDSFSLGFRGSPSSEHEFARNTAEYLGLKHHELLLEKEDTLDVETIGRIVDEPNGDTSLLPTWHLCKLAREHVKVALSGDGADELFGGYSRYALTLATAKDQPIGSQYYSNRILVFTDDELQAYLQGAPAGFLRKVDDARRELDSSNSPIIDRLRSTDIERYMPGAVLAKVDRMSMQHGLEVRTPFLNRDIARFAEKLGPDALVHEGTGKQVLRRLAERYLSKETIYRPKSGFGLPLEQWGREKLNENWIKVIQRSPSHIRWWLPNPEISSNKINTYQTWAMLVMGIFLENNFYKPDQHSYGPRQLNALRRVRKSGHPVTALSLRHPLGLNELLPQGSAIVSPAADPNESGCLRLDWLNNIAQLEDSLKDLPNASILMEEKLPLENVDDIANFLTIQRLPASPFPGSHNSTYNKPKFKPVFFDPIQNDRLPFTQRSAISDLKGHFSTRPKPKHEGDTSFLFQDNVPLFNRNTPRRSLQLLQELRSFLQTLRREKRSLNSLNSFEPSNDHFDNRVVLFTSSLSSGGAERQLALLAIELRKLGVDVEVWVLDPLEGARAHYLHILQSAKVPTWSLAESSVDPKLAVPATDVSDSALETISRLAPYLGEAVWLATRMLLARKPKVLHSFLDTPNIISGWSGIIAGVPEIIQSFRNANPSHFGLYQPWFRRHYLGLLRARKITLSGNSKYGNSDYAKWLNLPNKQIHLTPNGVDINRFQPNTDAANFVRKKHSISTDKQIVFSAFRFSREKDPDTYLETVKKICENLASVHFLLAGEGPLRSNIEDRVSKSSFADRFTFLGRVNKPELYYAAADITLHSSTHEGMPNALLEAQSCGCPVVATAAGGTTEVVIDGKTGLLSPVYDYNQLATHSIALLHNPIARASIGSAARSWIVERFSLQASRDTCLKLYDLKQPASSPQKT